MKNQATSSEERVARQQLEDVQTGDYVWIDTKYSSGRIDTRLTKITHKGENGRLYICVQDATQSWGDSFGKKLVDNWRYGFDPETGKAHHYKNDTMRFASPEDVQDELSKREASKEEEAQKNAESHRLYLLKEAAPSMYEALANLENDDNSIPAHVWKLVQDALALARGETK